MLNTTFTSVSIRKLPCANFDEQNTKAEDVHLGRLSCRVAGLRSSIGHTARPNRVKLPANVRRAVIGDFGFPAVDWQRLQKDIGTADVSVDDGIWLHEVEVVKSKGDIATDGHCVTQWQVNFLVSENCSQVGRHQFSKDDELARVVERGADELEEVGVTDPRGQVDLADKQSAVVCGYDRFVHALCRHLKPTKVGHLYYSPGSPTKLSVRELNLFVLHHPKGLLARTRFGCCGGGS